MFSFIYMLIIRDFHDLCWYGIKNFKTRSTDNPWTSNIGLKPKTLQLLSFKHKSIRLKSRHHDTWQVYIFLIKDFDIYLFIIYVWMIKLSVFSWKKKKVEETNIWYSHESELPLIWTIQMKNKFSGDDCLL